MRDQNNTSISSPRCGSSYRAIRSWRERPAAQASQFMAFGTGAFARALRQERALSGRQGYDINRHIRLVRSQP